MRTLRDDDIMADIITDAGITFFIHTKHLDNKQNLVDVLLNTCIRISVGYKPVYFYTSPLLYVHGYDHQKLDHSLLCLHFQILRL